MQGNGTRQLAKDEQRGGHLFIYFNDQVHQFNLFERFTLRNTYPHFNFKMNILC